MTWEARPLGKPDPYHSGLAVDFEIWDDANVCHAYVAGADVARLIAAAPDLLDALSNLVRNANLYEDSPYIEAAHAAIAKTDGRS